MAGIGHRRDGHIPPVLHSCVVARFRQKTFQCLQVPRCSACRMKRGIFRRVREESNQPLMRCLS